MCFCAGARHRPGFRRDGIRDVAIRKGKIAAMHADILPTSAKEVIDVTGKIVLPEMIHHLPMRHIDRRHHFFAPGPGPSSSIKYASSMSSASLVASAASYIIRLHPGSRP